MADSTEGDTNVQDLGLLAPALIILIPGLLIHSFIIGVNVNDWWKGRSVTPVDHIVTSLGISRMCAECANILYLSVAILLPTSQYSHLTLVISKAGYTFFTYANICITTLLSIVYCLKISNLHTRLFLYLRRVIVQRTVYFILASVIFSALKTLRHLWTALTTKTKAGTFNTTMNSQFTDCIPHDTVYSFIIENSIPLFFYYVSSVLLFASLYHHTTKMKMSSNLTIHLETYYSVMKFVCFTFIYNTIYINGHFAWALYYYFYCMFHLWPHSVVGFLPALHSSYLIYRTAKLRNQMSKVLQNINDFLFQMKVTET